MFGFLLLSRYFLLTNIWWIVHYSVKYRYLYLPVLSFSKSFNLDMCRQFNRLPMSLDIKEIASSEEFNTLTEKAGGLQDKDTLGNIYLIEDPKFLPAVVKITPAGKETVLIKDPIYFQSLCAPQPVLFFACGGLVMTAILGIVIKKKVEFPGVDAYTIRSCAKSQAKQ